jgi:ATP adenylyltransferase/5',5'''-P-1,P-4-tetraphosphate phosphorylase II
MYGITSTVLHTDRIFALYNPLQNPSSLSQMAADLLEQQKADWPQLKEAYHALANVRTRELQCDGFSVRLQFNPQRVVSSGAKVDAQSIQARPCFLCLENLPARQKGITYRDEFLVLCNPAPIFSQHYTIAHLQHRPQALAEYLPAFLKLAKDFSPNFSVFYNGPKCGASAPDHLHFQACPAGAIPVETQIHEAARRLLVKNVQGILLHKIQRLGRKILLLTGFDEEAMTSALQRVLAAAQEVTRNADEPLMNVICSFRDDLYQVLIFPRRKHRPQIYFRTGEDRVLISPASVDMGGLIVTPLEKDFLHVDAQLVANIYREVSITPDTLRRIISLL